MKTKRRFFSVMMILCLLITSSSFTSFAASGNYVKVTATQSYSDAQKMLKLINKQRTKRGLAKLKLDKSLTKSAAKRAAELMIYIPETSPHKRPNGKLTKSINSRIIYECCAEGYETPKDAMQGWMSSPPHKKGILLSNARSVGIGCITSKNGDKYWTLDFSSSKAQKIEKRKTKVSSTYKITALSKYLKKSNFFLAQKDSVTGMLDEWATLEVGETARIYPAFQNNFDFQTQLRPSDYTWKSSNKAVATVDSKGRVKAKKAGEVIIYAKMKDSLGYKLKLELEVSEAFDDYDYYYDDDEYYYDY